MSGWVCLECGNAKIFEESGVAYTDVTQTVDAEGNIEIDNSTTEPGDNPEAKCSECQSERVVWAENVEDLTDYFENDDEWEGFLGMFLEKNDLNNLTISPSNAPRQGLRSNSQKSKKIDVNAKLGGERKCAE